MTKHFVTFYSPGTFLMETDQREIEAWDVDAAVELAKSIDQRYGARPHSFKFSTSHRAEDDWQPKIVEESPLYILGGTVKAIADLEAENDPSNEIAIANMRRNGIERVVDNRNSYKSMLPLRDGDVLLDVVLTK